MDSLFLLAGLLGLGDVILARVWLRDRARRQKAERVANAALRDNYKLMTALERRASGQPRGGGPVIVEMPTTPRQIRDAISALGAAREPLSPTDVIRLTKLPRWRVMRTLLSMHDAGQLTKVGVRRSAKYALPTTPRPGAAAGTRALLPVGPPSAKGRQASSGGFEVAWNGTKERNGEAPAILSGAGRERKG